MDLSGLKWPLIILVVLVVVWLASSGGVNWMVKNFSKATPGQDEARDATDEAGLSRVAGYLCLMLRWQKASDVLLLTMERYPNGKNYWFNLFRLAKCYEKMERYQECYDILQELMAINASQFDPRVQENENMLLRASKLKELHELR